MSHFHHQPIFLVDICVRREDSLQTTHLIDHPCAVVEGLAEPGDDSLSYVRVEVAEHTFRQE
jgi:hypothetical protein